MYEMKKFANGFEYIEFWNETMHAKIALQGAHIFEYKRKNLDDILWLSPRSDFEYGKAIRGGIPICWPRFGSFDENMPSHGFSRTSLFKFIGVKQLDETNLQVIFKLIDTQESRKIWNYKFELEVIFTLGASLKVELITHNRDLKEFLITQALHTYFAVSHIDTVAIYGLEDQPFLDTLEDKKSVENHCVKIAKEVDRVYSAEVKKILLKDENRELCITSEGSASTVVWNPWIEKGSRMSGMQKSGYKEFVCIETANAFDDSRVIKPSENYSIVMQVE